MIRNLFSKLVDDAASSMGLQGFRDPDTGIRFIHPGLIVDQAALRAEINKAVERVVVRNNLDEASAKRITRSIRVTITPQTRTRLRMSAEWTGGIFDRGEVYLESGDELPERAAAAVKALMLKELDVHEDET